MIYELQFTPGGNEYTIDTQEQIEKLILSYARAALELGELTISAKERGTVITLLIVNKVEDTR
jgi:hypothetical protein